MKYNFLYQITAASRTTKQGGYRPQITDLSRLCPQLNLMNPPPPQPRNKIPGYATGMAGKNLIGSRRRRNTLKIFRLK